MVVLAFLFLLLFSNRFLFSEEGFRLIATLSGEKEGDEFCTVCGVGDVNGDGYNDIAVGAREGNYVKIYFGGSPFDTVCDLRLSCTAGSYFGHSIAGGDFNGDGYSDIVVGAPLYSADGNYWGGRVYVYFGGENMDSIPDLVMMPEYWRALLGVAVANGGDVNGDGYNDLLAGALHDEYMRGHVYIYYGGAKMDNVYDVHIEGRIEGEGNSVIGDFIGEAIDGVGDVNKDGYDDILIGASGEGEGPGKAYLVYGGDNIGLENAEILYGDTVGYKDFGRWVSGLDDVNGDGYPDLGVLALDYFEIISGKSFEVLIRKCLWRKWNHCQSVADLKDLNNDGYSDFLIGISNGDSAYTGEAEIYFGKAEIDTTPDHHLYGKIPHYYFGKSASYIGDINKDGYKEIAISELNKVYIFSFGDFNSIKVSNPETISDEYRLYQNYPNPFNDITMIVYEVGWHCNVDLDIYDLRGQKVRSLFSGEKSRGTHSIIWDGRDDSGRIVPTGIYLYKLEIRNGERIYVDIRKMLFLK